MAFATVTIFTAFLWGTFVVISAGFTAITFQWLTLVIHTCVTISTSRVFAAFIFYTLVRITVLAVTFSALQWHTFVFIIAYFTLSTVLIHFTTVGSCRNTLIINAHLTRSFAFYRGAFVIETDLTISTITVITALQFFTLMVFNDMTIGTKRDNAFMFMTLVS